ncbi:4,5-DOPA-extradiol-dioxygenase [Faecalibacter macacae]|uniref:4,5-DOPA dioxygenase extradiol n=1 Tax=Faecalibacter macacae TaxID=1859289 RepID=A0A3L9M7T0_9FLAO|nr:4,5-DOPA dioxygenase extradiol [Faecalibacter macacae]RLZ09297.1 4,5-DOPA dioxygenase extradiol [Faecalibacter macacae]
MSLQELGKFTETLSETEEMPILFLGHGSPMIALEENQFVTGFRDIVKKIPTPKAIVCISAHWETKGTFVTAMTSPPTIHDFGGFPQALHDVQYPAPGNPDLAKEIKQIIKSAEVGLDIEWGLDHGAWTVIKHMYPDANIPIVEFSLDYRRTPEQHYQLAQELKALRKKGVLIIGSGNIVHNLRAVAWNRINDVFGFDWAIEANETIKKAIIDRNHKPLMNPFDQGQAFQLAIPTPEHYLPLLYALALEGKDDEISFFNDEPVAGSLSMTSVYIGKNI